MRFLKVLPIVVLAAACSSAPKQGKEEQASQAQKPGPAIVEPRMTSEVIDVNAQLKKANAPNVLVDVKDRTSKVDDVKLVVNLEQFPSETANTGALKNPVEIPMKKLGGTTWGAQFTDDVLSRLALNGQELTYEGRVIARNDNGGVSISQDPVRFTVRAPAVVEQG